MSSAIKNPKSYFSSTTTLNLFYVRRVKRVKEQYDICFFRHQDFITTMNDTRRREKYSMNVTMTKSSKCNWTLILLIKYFYSYLK